MRAKRGKLIIYIVCLIAFIAWTSLIAFESVSDISFEKQKNIEIARKEVLTVLNKDIAFRLWATGHGGVYVPVSEKTMPNKYLEHIPERDIATPSGKELTLMNPAYILKQIMDDYTTLYGVKGHITSLDVINPVNEPDIWERQALERFKSEAVEITEIESIGQEPFFRMISPMITTEGCLKCHGQQGYSVGDVRGGISVAIPYKPYLLAEKRIIRKKLIVHIFYWISGISGLFIFTFWGKNKLSQLDISQKDLEKRESEFKSIIENSPVPMVIVDQKGDVISYNNKFNRQFGYSIEDISTAEGWWSNVYPDPVYREQVRSDWEQAVLKSQATGKEIETQVWNMVSKNGEKHTVEFNLTLLKTISVIAMNDITEQRKGEVLLRNSEERYREAQQIAHIGHWELNITNKKLLMSDEMFNIFGIEAENFDTSFESLREVIHPDDKDMINEVYENSLRKREPYRVVYRILLNNDRIKYVQEMCQTEYNDMYEPVRSIGTVQDISERKDAEEEHVKFEAIVEQTGESIVIADIEGNILYVNPGFEQISGYSREEVLGKNPRILKSGKQDASFYRRMWKDLKDGKTWKGHMINRRKNGCLYEEDVTISPVLDKEGKVFNYVAVKRDVTKEREISQQLQQAQKMEAIGTLAGGIAHDFNNLLAVILGYTDLAMGYANHESELLSGLEKISAAGNRAKDLVVQILAFSRQAEVERIPMQLQPYIKEALKMLRSTLPSTIKICADIDSGSDVVQADPIQIHQILMNLCTNASHVMEKTGGVLKVVLKNTYIIGKGDQGVLDLIEGEYVELVVSDNGPGIAPDILDKIFDPYFTTKEVGRGTGLGLAIIHGIITGYGGGITVDSKLGIGTDFHLYFPVVGETGYLQPVKDSNTIPTGNGRILFVDDEELIVGLGKRMLEGLGYDVTASLSCSEALSTFRSNYDDFDIVITDQTMPHMTGFDLAREILQIRPDIPVVLCTGYSDLVDEEKAKSAGIREFVLKPVTKKTFAELLQKILN